MGYLFTRQQLYELVWAGPITTLAKSLVISDASGFNPYRNPERGAAIRPREGARRAASTAPIHALTHCR
jgi:hypothetical protein